MENKIILDFDGTITDIEEESKKFQELYPLIMFDKFQIARNKYLPFFIEIKEELIKNEIKGFKICNFDSLPASSDPYILTQATGQEFCRRFDYHVDDESKFLINLYNETNLKISKSKNSYREGKKRTKKFLDIILKNNDLVFVTTSEKEKVESYLKEIGEEYLKNISVVGNAGKLFVEKEFKEVPMCFRPLNFPRDVLLRREKYYKILKNLEKNGFTPDKTTVVGDVYELDLGLPEYLGYKVVQIENGYSKEHERKYLGKNFVKNYNELERLIL